MRRVACDLTLLRREEEEEEGREHTPLDVGRILQAEADQSLVELEELLRRNRFIFSLSFLPYVFPLIWP